MTQAASKRLYTPAEYYQREQKAESKSDYYRGEIFAMAGGSVRHSRICSNLIRELGVRLKGKPCTEYESNLRLLIRATGLRCYPDAGVYCGPLEHDADDSTGETVTNPTVLVEVLSPSTEAYDRGFKAESYRMIPSLQAHLLVSQDRPHVGLYLRKPNGRWELQEASDLSAVLSIEPIGVELPLAEIYYRVDFANDADGRESSRS